MSATVWTTCSTSPSRPAKSPPSARTLATGAGRVEDVSGAIVVPGLIDIHTHVYHKATSLSVDPGFIARRSATTTMVDAGSAGAGNYDGFRDYVMAQSPYRIFAFLNISFPGIFGFDKGVSIGEATVREMLPVDRCVAKIEANRDRIVGVKVRIGGPVTGELGLGALELALEAANAVGLPLMTHIGTAPPSYADVVSMLRPGDILTHCFRPEPNSAVAAGGRVLKEVRAARERGVLFDIAHGMGAFGYDTTEAALKEGFPPDLISSDVHVIAVEGPGFDLLHTMSKLLNCGLTLPQVIGMSSSRPALAIRTSGTGASRSRRSRRHHGAAAGRQRLCVRGRRRHDPPGFDAAAACGGLPGREADGSLAQGFRGAVHPAAITHTTTEARRNELQGHLHLCLGPGGDRDRGGRQ